MILYQGTLRKCGVIHALMREVADLESGNFRGVCPILNRAKELLEGMEILANFCTNGSLAAVPELTATPAIAGFIMCR